LGFGSSLGPWGAILKVEMHNGKGYPLAGQSEMIFDRNLNLNLAMIMSTVATFLLILSWLAVTHSSLHHTGQGSHVEIKVDGIKVFVDPCSLETRPGGTASEVLCQ
jgi:hypothetical protein